MMTAEPNAKEQRTLVSDLMWLMDMAETRGLLLDDLLDRMTSRSYTLERARAIVNRATQLLLER